MTATQIQHMAQRACFIASVQVHRTGADSSAVRKAWTDAWAAEFRRLGQLDKAQPVEG